MPRVGISTVVEPSWRDPDQHVTLSPPSRALGTLVVIGNGMAGHRLCQRLVAAGAHERYRIVVFGEEARPAYDRVHLTDLFAGRSEDDLQLAPLSWYEDHDIDLRLGDPAVAIERRRRTVRSASGLQVAYRKLVFATGSSAFVPPIDGIGLSQVFLYRTIRDARAIREHARTARTAAVIGGGLLGLEAARALQQLGLELLIVEAAAAIMPTQLDQAAGKELERQIAALGIRVETAAMTKCIAADGAQRTLVFGDGTSLTVDMVVVAAGVRPRVELAAAAGLTCSPTGGIVVDDDLRTSDPNIHAIGECASHRSQTWGLVAPAYAMADVLAANLTGASLRFAGRAPSTKLKLMGVDVATAGEPLETGVVIGFRSDGVYRRLRLEHGRLVGALGVGPWPEASQVQDATTRHQRLWPWQVARFENTGELWGQRRLPASRLRVDSVVCSCLSITRGQVATACAGGTATVEAIAQRTGASTICGSCRPLIAELTGTRSERASPAWGLLAASAGAAVLVLMVLLATPVPLSASMRDPFRLDLLWRDTYLRQLTGCGLLGLSVIASLLSVRKRWRRLSLGAFTTWRSAHAAIGMLTLMMLAVHTGMRLGDNVNFALFASFATVNMVGAAAGGLTAVERACGTTLGAQCRRLLVGAHLIAMWPLPLLVVFHVIAVYYF
jgi:NAD(P)H-nitrite reductase large subunit